MGPDHPVTGGYLQPATVISGDLWKLAQLEPGEHVRLIAV
jgi:urea carboxylase